MWELIETSKADEVMFFVPHGEELSPGLGTIEECEKVAALLAPVFRKLRKRNIAPSINMWWTLGFSHYPGDARVCDDRFDFRWAVAENGTVSRCIACPRDQRWLDHVNQMYRIFGALKPQRIWADDDTRATLRAGLQSFCYCEDCLAEMGKRTGRMWTRTELLKAVLADPPNTVRDAMFAFQADMLKTIVRGAAETVHAVSPGTHVSLMVSDIEGHASEGRVWEDHLGALGSPVPWVRPGLGGYTESISVDFVSGINISRQVMHVLPKHIPMAGEIENYPFSTYFKSASVVRLQLAFAQLIGMPEVTFDLYRFCGRLDLLADHRCVEMLGRDKPFMQALADLGIDRQQQEGIGLYINPAIGRHVRGVGNAAKTNALIRSRAWDSILPAMGFATKYGTGDVTVLTGEQVMCLRDDEIQRMFAKGVLLDARAAESLIMLGKGDLCGVAARKEDVPAVIEEITDGRFGAQGDLLNFRAEPARPWQFELTKDARIVSRICSYAMKPTGHGIVVSQNHLGGRTAIVPFDTQAGGLLSSSFMNESRKRQFHALLQWLNRKPLALVTPHVQTLFPILVVQEDRIIVGIGNPHGDAISDLTFTVCLASRKPGKVESLRDNGRWKQDKVRMVKEKHGAFTIRTTQRVEHNGIAVFKIATAAQ